MEYIYRLQSHGGAVQPLHAPGSLTCTRPAAVPFPDISSNPMNRHHHQIQMDPPVHPCDRQGQKDPRHRQ